MNKIMKYIICALVFFVLSSCTDLTDYTQGFRAGYSVGRYCRSSREPLKNNKKLGGDYVKGYNEGLTAGYLDNCKK